MKIQSLHLENYRCFEKLDIDFDPQLTVLVGDNGSGKTAVLDAVAAFLQRFIELSGSDDILRGVTFDIVKPNMFEVSDLTIGTPKWIICDYTVVEERYKKGTPFSVAYTGRLSKSGDEIETVPVKKTDGEYTIQKIRNNDGTSTYMMPHITENLILSPVINQYQQCEENTKYPDGKHPKCDECRTTGRCATPIFVQYSSQRSLKAYIQQANDTASKMRKKNGVVFSPNLDFQKSLKWFDAKDAEEARARSNKPDKKGYRDSILKAVRDAISKALGTDGNTYEFPHMDSVPPKLFINHRESGIPYEVGQLSDGYRTMLALVMDLARRMATANEHVKWPEGQTVLHSPGIVLIDEVELHLHPSWQQTVLPKLTEIFPNVQFIVTTHSPQVLTSIEPKHIRVLKDGQAFPVQSSSFGAESWRVLEDILQVPSRPDNDAKKELDKYLKMINNGQGKSEDALQSRKKLDEWLAEDPVLDEADMFIIRDERLKAREGKSRA